MPPFSRKKVVKDANPKPEPTVADLWRATASAPEGDSPARAQGTLAAIAYNAPEQPAQRFAPGTGVVPSAALLDKWAAEESGR